MTVKNEFDSYWKLDSYDEMKKAAVFQRLVNLGYVRTKATWTKYDLVPILHRHDCGLVCYEKCSDEEIRKFAGNRGINEYRTVAEGYRRTVLKGRSILIMDLEARDRQLEFSHFLDLPAELRNRVYELYVSEFPGTLRLPTKPPLAGTCKLLRQEVLPVFYANLEFEIHLTQHPCSLDRYLEEPMSQLFLLNLAPTDVVYMRKLKLVINRHLRSTPDRYLCETQFWYHLDLDLKQCRLGLQQSEKVSLSEWWAWHALEVLRERIDKLIENLHEANGRKTLTIQDIHYFRTLVEQPV